MIQVKISLPFDLAKELEEDKSKLARNLDKVIQKTAHDVRNAAVKGIQRGSKTGRDYKRRTVTHKASAPGEYPASWTGHLADSIRINKGFLEAEVGSDLLYAPFLEEGTERMQPRPFLEPSYQKTEEAFSKLIDEAIEASLKD